MCVCNKSPNMNITYLITSYSRVSSGAGKAGKRVVFQKKAGKNMQIQQLRLEKLEKNYCLECFFYCIVSIINSFVFIFGNLVYFSIKIILFFAVLFIVYYDVL